MNKADLLILSLFQLLINKINDWTGKDRFFLAKIFLMLMPLFLAFLFIEGVLWADFIGAKIGMTVLAVALVAMTFLRIKQFSYVKDIEKRAEFMDNPSDALDMKYHMIMDDASSERFRLLAVSVVFGFFSIAPGYINRLLLFYIVVILLHSLFLYVLSCANPPGRKQKKLVLQRQTN